MEARARGLDGACAVSKKTTVYLAGKISVKRAMTIWARTLFVTGQTLIIPVKFEPTIKEWTGATPTFSSEVQKGSFQILHQIRLVGDQHGIDKWFWLSFGTDVRYAVMTPDFVSKTQPGRLGNRKGKGGFSHFSLVPLPGIEAREWHDIIAETSGRIYRFRLYKATRANIKKFQVKSKKVKV